MKKQTLVLFVTCLLITLFIETVVVKADDPTPPDQPISVLYSQLYTKSGFIILLKKETLLFIQDINLVYILVLKISTLMLYKQ